MGDHWTPYSPPTEFPQGARVHIVEKGDTLWALAQKYLGDPYLWPQIWERNRYVLDSHWIYPGDPIVIDVAVQEPKAAGTGQEQAPATGAATPALPPTEAAAPAEQVVPAEAGPASIPYPLGTSADVYCFARLFEDEGIFPFAISSAERIGYQNQFSDGDVVYIDGGSQEGVRPGDRFFIFHRIRPLNHPVSSAAIGIVYQQMGQLKVLCAQEHSSIAEVTLTCDPIVIGDHLLPFEPVPVPLVTAPPVTNRCDAPNGKPTGYVVFSRDDVENTAADSLVMTDLGTREGLYPGQFATIFRDNPVQGMPRVLVGELGFLTVYEGYSTARITRSAVTVQIGDRIELK